MLYMWPSLSNDAIVMQRMREMQRAHLQLQAAVRPLPPSPCCVYCVVCLCVCLCVCCECVCVCVRACVRVVNVL